MAPGRRQGQVRFLRRGPALLAIGLAFSSACAQSVPPDETEGLVLEVGPEKVQCQGEASQLCLLVRESADGVWRHFYSPIEGFEHEEGFQYLIEVERTRIPNPPADASSFRYRLLRVLSKEAVIG
jgi:hypothetical protein